MAPAFRPQRQQHVFADRQGEFLHQAGITERLNVAVIGTADELDLDDAGGMGDFILSVASWRLSEFIQHLLIARTGPTLVLPIFSQIRIKAFLQGWGPLLIGRSIESITTVLAPTVVRSRVLAAWVASDAAG